MRRSLSMRRCQCVVAYVSEPNEDQADSSESSDSSQYASAKEESDFPMWNIILFLIDELHEVELVVDEVETDEVETNEFVVDEVEMEEFDVDENMLVSSVP